MEQTQRVVRTRGRFGVELHAEGALRSRAQALHAVIVEIDMRDLNVTWESVGTNGKAVIVRGDFDAACEMILHRLIAAAVSEFEFVGFAPERESQNLVPQAYSKNRHASEKLAHRVNRTSHRSGIARTIGKENAVRLERERVVCRRIGGNDRYMAAVRS